MLILDVLEDLKLIKLCLNKTLQNEKQKRVWNFNLKEFTLNIICKIETKDNEKKLQIVSEHVPVSVSIFSNVPEYDDKPIFICDSNPKKLIKYFNSEYRTH